MNKKTMKSLKRLRSFCGKNVRQVALSLGYYEGDLVGYILSVGVELENGLVMKFGCEGSGNLWVHKGEFHSIKYHVGGVDEEIQVHEITQFANSVLEDVEYLGEVLILTFEAGVLRIENVDDEFDITIDNEALSDKILLHE